MTSIYDSLRGFGATIRSFREDGWENAVTGLGTRRDKASYGTFCPSFRLSDTELSSLFHFHDLTKRIVSTKPKEMLRKGFKVAIDEDTETSETVNQVVRDMNILQLFLEGMIWGNLYGGCLLIAGIDDGKDMSEPLSPDAPIRSIRYMFLLDKRYVWPVSYYEDPQDKKYEQVEVYQIGTPEGTLFSKVHESRCIRFGGAMTDFLQRRAWNGWDMSVLQAVYDTARASEENWKSANHLLADASQAVFKIKGLINAITTPKGVETMTTRMQLVDMCRSVARAVLLDADSNESFERTTTNFAGIPDFLDKNMMRVASAAEIPVSILYGRSAAGLNATGDGDYRWFYDGIAADRLHILDPMLRRVIGWIMSAQDGPTGGAIPDEWCIDYPLLWEPSPTEKAAISKSKAEEDCLYITNQVYFPEEVALARARGGVDATVEIDEELRERMLKNEKDLANADPSKKAVPNAAPVGNAGPLPSPSGGGTDVPANNASPGSTTEEDLTDRQP